MILATPDDQTVIKTMIAAAVYDNPKVQFQLGKKNYDKKVKWLSWFIYQMAMKRKSIYLSDNKEAMIIFMRSHLWKKNISDLPFYIRLFFSAFDWSQIFRIVKMENQLTQLRPTGEDYLYVWVLGSLTTSKGSGAAQAIKRDLFQISKKLQLPIYAETAFEQNQRVFARYGFLTYFTQSYPEIPLHIHFMKRPID
jgi:hypothetical protein